MYIHLTVYKNYNGKFYIDTVKKKYLMINKNYIESYFL